MAAIQRKACYGMMFPDALHHPTDKPDHEARFAPGRPRWEPLKQPANARWAVPGPTLLRCGYRVWTLRNASECDNLQIDRNSLTYGGKGLFGHSARFF
jgi:hypothetical protein